MSEILTVREVALLLKLHPRTVMKMAASGTLPAAKVGRKWRFDKELVEKWLTSQMSAAGGMDSTVPNHFRLSEMIADSHTVIFEKPASQVEILSRLAACANGSLHELTHEQLVELLQQRESLYSTAMDTGVAFPHPRHPVPGLSEPVVALGIAPEGIEFGGPQNKPTYVFAMVCAPTDRIHLRLLGRLSRIFHDSKIVERLRSCKTPKQILETLRQCETAALPKQQNR